MIVVAVVLGLFRLHWSYVLLPVALWIALLMTAGDPTVSRGELAIGGGLLALFNALPGYGLGRGVRTLIDTVRTDVGAHLAAARDEARSELDASESDAP